MGSGAVIPEAAQGSARLLEALEKLAEWAGSGPGGNGPSGPPSEDVVRAFEEALAGPSEGAEAEAHSPENVLTKASTVGFPRESIISCAKTFSILFLFFILPLTCRICGIYQSVVQFVTIIYPYSDFIPYMNKKRRQRQYTRIGEDIAKKRQKQKCIISDFSDGGRRKSTLTACYSFPPSESE